MLEAHLDSGQDEERTVESDVVGLDKGLLDLAVLNQKSVALAAVVAEDGGALKGDIESIGELSGGVTEEANLFVSRLVCYELPDEGWPCGRGIPCQWRLLTPLLPSGSRDSAHALVLIYISPSEQDGCGRRHSHERVIDSNDKDLAGVLEFRVVDESRNVGARASGA